MSEQDARQASALWAALGDPQQAGALVGLGFDLLMQQPVGRFVTPERVLEGIDQALAPAHLERALAHLSGFFQRDATRAAQRGDRVQDYLTAEARQALRRLLAQPVELDPAFVEALVRQDAIRHLLRSVVEETVQRFARALKPDAKNGLWGQLPRGPGVGLLTKMASQMESQLQRAATRFVSGSLEVLLGRLAHILGTPETAAQLGRLRAEGFDQLMPLTTHTLWRLSRRLPLDELIGLVPPLVRHNLARPELRETLRAEIEAILESEAAVPLEELMDPAAVASYRAQAVSLGGPLLVELRASEALGSWLAAAAGAGRRD